VEAKAPAWPLWDGKEAVAEYAKRIGLPPTLALELAHGVQMELALIPAGRFTMGSPKDEKGRNYDEKPHEVTISKPFYMARHETTQGQYQAVIDNNPVINKFEKNPNRPVNSVSWQDALVYCFKLGRKVGRDVRLPTEAEWEFACRAGTQTPYYTGATAGDLDQAGWYKGNIKEHVQPVARKKPNAFGLYDMYGNAAEWCQDWYEEYPEAPMTDPRGASIGLGRVVRGGSWLRPAEQCRSASRQWVRSVDRPGYLGFRVAVSAPQKAP
jgi:formylglycine-generating enzyme required for sulfatase activity